MQEPNEPSYDEIRQQEIDDAADDRPKRHGLGNYDDGMVALGYREGSSNDEPEVSK